MIILHFHLQPQFKKELFHIYFTSFRRLIVLNESTHFCSPIFAVLRFIRYKKGKYLLFAQNDLREAQRAKLDSHKV